MNQVVIGLDQNYLINLGGALLNSKFANVNLWHSLLDKFVDLIFKKEKVICPYSEFTEREASTGFHRVPLLKELSKLLSKGWDFNYWSSNLELQLVCSLLSIFNKPCPQNIDLGKGKSEYFKMYLTSGSRYAKVKISNKADLKAMTRYYAEHYLLQFPDSEQVRLSGELFDIMQYVKKDKFYPSEIHANSMIKEFMRHSRTFFDVMRPWQRGVRPHIVDTDEGTKSIWLTYWRCYPPEKIPLSILFNELQDGGWNIKSVDSEFINALNNKLIYEIPFIKVWATLWEYFQKYPKSFTKNMKTASWDFFRTASMLPACYIYCTDEEMKNALYQTKLVEHFNVTVYDSTKGSLRNILNNLNSLTD